MQNTHYFVGVDLGTSAIKLLLMDAERQVIARQTVGYDIDQPAFGWREIDPEVWFRGMERGMLALLAGHDPQLVDAIGVTGQMHTLVMLDEAGESLRPAIMWDDTRTRDLAAELREVLSREPDCAYIAKTISTGSPATNLYWLKRYEPENFARLRKFLIAPDYLVYRLTGVCGVDYCEASTSCLYDMQSREWSPYLRDLLGLDASVYPEVWGSAMAAGKLLPQMAERFAMRQDVKVLVGTGDNAATAISTGCLGQGYPVISLGTSGVLMMRTERLELDAKGKVILFSPDGETFSHLVQGVLQSNGTAFEWWVRSVLQIDDFKLVDSMLEQKPIRQGKLLFFPHLMGEKTLFSDPDLSGAFIGLSTQTTREDMMYAVLEGLSFGYRELAEAMRLEVRDYGTVKIVGGGSRSTAWAQVLANVLNVGVEQMDGMVGPAFGIALLAAYHCGHIADLRDIAGGTLKVKRLFSPQPEMVEISEERYRFYLRIHRALRSIYQ